MPTPERIASLLASSTEILYALGLGDRVVAISHECDFPAEATTKPRVTRTNVAAEAPSGQIDRQVRSMVSQGAALYELDVEALAALAPELIVTQSQCDVCAVRYQDVLDAVNSHPALRETRVVSLNPMTLDEIYADILRVGEAADVLDEAQCYVELLRVRVKAIRQQTESLAADERPRVVCIEWIEPLMVAANWMPELIELAGGQQPLPGGGQHSTYGDWSEVLRYDPEIVVVMPCGFDLARTVEETPTLARMEGWSGLTAVRQGQVWAVDGNAYFNRSGPRMIESLEILAHLVHPTRFAPPKLAAADRPWVRVE